MFCAGDEFLHTRDGNNNPYNQDNDINYLDWDLLRSEPGRVPLFAVDDRVPQGSSVDRAEPVLARRYHLVRRRGKDVDFSPQGQTLAYCLYGASLHDADVYVMINGSPRPQPFRVQVGQAADWLLVADTGLPSPHDIADPSPVTNSRSKVLTTRCRQEAWWCSAGL